jgi:predicted enzyme related to lactoylglutathione lyase
VYIGVADTDATVAKATSLGATVVQPADDTPYGRLAVIADPTGAQVSLMGPNDATPAK